MYVTRRLVVVIAIIITISSCNSKKDQQAFGGGARRPQGPLQVDGFIVSQRPISEKIEVPGTLFPFEETQLRAEVGGRVVQLNIQEGTAVSKGTMLVKLFDRDLQAQLKKLQVQLQIKDKTKSKTLRRTSKQRRLRSRKQRSVRRTTVRLAYVTSALVPMCHRMI